MGQARGSALYANTGTLKRFPACRILRGRAGKARSWSVSPSRRGSLQVGAARRCRAGKERATRARQAARDGQVTVAASYLGERPLRPLARLHIPRPHPSRARVPRPRAGLPATVRCLAIRHAAPCRGAAARVRICCTDAAA
jgi:hypothetical protein